MRRVIDMAATVLFWAIAALGWVAFWYVVSAFVWYVITLK